MPLWLWPKTLLWFLYSPLSMILDMEECNNNGSRWTTTSDGFIAERKCSTYKRHCDINYKYIFLNQTSNLQYQTLFTSNQNWNNKVFKEIFILIANIYLLCLFCVIKQPLLSPSRHRFGTLPSFSPYVAWDQHSSAEMTCSQWHRKYTTLKKLIQNSSPLQSTNYSKLFHFQKLKYHSKAKC